MHILIIDGGPWGRSIAERLLAQDAAFRKGFSSPKHHVTFVENDEAHCGELADRYDASVVWGDGTKQSVFRQIDVEEIDVVIAASDDDARNAIAALQAKRLGVERVIAVVQDPDYVSLPREEGIMSVSVPSSTAVMVERHLDQSHFSQSHLDRPGVADSFEIGSGVASFTDVTVPEGMRVVGRCLRDVDMPDECVAAAVIREKQFVVPHGRTQIAAGDRIVFVGSPESVEKSRDIFRG